MRFPSIARLTGRSLALALLHVSFAQPAHATGLNIVTTRVTQLTANRLRVSASVTWDNAWRNARNRDAVWLFLKYRVPGSAEWRHARVRTITAESSRILCSPSTDRVGAFCTPSATFRGTASTNVTIDADIVGTPGASAQAILLGTEMVHVPAGAFTIGDIDTASVAQAAFYRSDAQGAHAGTYRVQSEASIDVRPANGALYYRSVNQYQGDRAGPIPAAFPKGTKAFYIMKYELLQGEYATFLNMIGPAASMRDISTTKMYREHRGTIELHDTTYRATSPERPANMVSWDDGTAFADWAGLRPLTELEFTKAARGPVEPMASDYPWGTNSKARLLRRIDESGDLARTGAVSESRLTDSTRDVLGASYWWVMDLAGSVWEKVVTIGNPIGRAFTGSHGDGVLVDGRATNSDWPHGDVEQDGGGYGYRGGGFYDWATERARDPLARALNPFSPVEWRPYGSWGGAPRSVGYGFRAGRSAD